MNVARAMNVKCELLNLLEIFDSRGDVKVIMVMKRIETLDSALISLARVDHKIEFLPNEKTKRRIFNMHPARMTLAEDALSGDKACRASTSRQFVLWQKNDDA